MNSLRLIGVSVLILGGLAGPAAAEGLDETFGSWTLVCDGFDDMGGITYENCRIFAAPSGGDGVVAGITFTDPAGGSRAIVDLAGDAQAVTRAELRLDDAVIAAGDCADGRCTTSGDRALVDRLASAGAFSIALDTAVEAADFSTDGLDRALARRDAALR